MGACKLRQRDRQVAKLAVSRDVVGDNTKKALLAALCRPSVNVRGCAKVADAW
jgi:hypothetical protein